MINWRKRIKITEYVIIDILCIIASYFVTNSFVHHSFVRTPHSNIETLFFIFITVAVIPFTFLVTGNYGNVIKDIRILSPKTDLHMLMSTMLSLAIITSILYYACYKAIEPIYMVVYAATLTALLLIGRVCKRMINKMSTRRINAVKNIVIVGHSESGEKYVDYIKSHKYLNMRIVGYIHIQEPIMYDDVKHLGELQDLPQIVVNEVVDEIVVARSVDSDSRLTEALDICREMGITITMMLECTIKDDIIKPHAAMVGDIPVIKYHSVSLNETQLMIKRLIDIVGASIGLVFFGIAFIIFGPIIKLETPGPIIFKQKRVGKNGRVFEIWKFRSMGVDAEKQKLALMSSNEMTGHMFKLENDPRVTAIGAIMRKTSIDELPQFWNVFKGDMSLVGTRPPTVEEVRNYELKHHRRISITPGITGNWQVNGRSDIKDFEEVVNLDMEYIKNWTLRKDIEILFKTILVVLRQKGSK